MCEESTDQALRDQLQAMLTIHPEWVEYRITIYQEPDTGDQLVWLKAHVGGCVLILGLPVTGSDWPEGYHYRIDGGQGLLQYPDRLARVLAQNISITSVRRVLRGVWGAGV